MALPAPTIVIPGITASVLRDEYDLPPTEVWTTVKYRRHQRIALHPHDPRYEISEPARITPSHPFPLAYEDLIEEMRDEFSPNEEQPVPVYPFAYDWRMPLAQIEKQLGAFIKEVIDRTKLQRHYDEDQFNDNTVVNLIGHSMGGLIIAGYIQKSGGKITNKVVTLASPFQGSYEAILKIIIGTANPSGYDPGKAREGTDNLTPVAQ